MAWFKVDDNLAFHPKVIAAGNQAMGMWLRAGSWSAFQLTDGRVPIAMLDALGGSLDDAITLCAVGLWHGPGDDCAVCEEQGTMPVLDGYQFHDWLAPGMQPSRREKESERASNRERQRRWRETHRDATSGTFVSNGVTNGRSNGVSNATPVPSRPVPKDLMADPVSHLQVVSANGKNLTDSDLQRITAVTGGDNAHAAKTAGFILAKAPTDVRSPISYILAAINDDPDGYRYHRGAPRKTQECPLHKGEWADACRPCAIDRRLEAEHHA